MSNIVVKKSPGLSGKVRISGAKNAALPILAASLLCEGTCKIDEVPELDDIQILCRLMECLGASVTHFGSCVTVQAENLKNHIAPYELVRKMRASFLVMGPLLARVGKTRISLPGGCPIGTRPVDLHLKGFAAMGADIHTGHGYVEAKAEHLHGAKVYLDFPSVGATENIMMAACLADGVTCIENAATEPEIVDLANFLIGAGADVKGAGTDTIRINGVRRLLGTNHSVIPDRIEAGTFMIASAITHGDVYIDNVVPNHLKPLTAKLREMGVVIDEGEDIIRVDGTGKLKSADIKTLPFPGFPTDMQAPITTLMSVTDGTSVIVETIFENRFLHAAELSRMGANIKIDGRTAVVDGIKNLTGAQVKATDLRAGAALMLAGLVAKGDTEIGEIGHIDRGYCDIVSKFRGLGARVERKE